MRAAGIEAQYRLSHRKPSAASAWNGYCRCSSDINRPGVDEAVQQKQSSDLDRKFRFALYLLLIQRRDLRSLKLLLLLNLCDIRRLRLVRRLSAHSRRS